MDVAQHVAQNTSGRSSAVSYSVAATEGYAMAAYNLTRMRTLGQIRLQGCKSGKSIGNVPKTAQNQPTSESNF